MDFLRISNFATGYVSYEYNMAMCVIILIIVSTETYSNLDYTYILFFKYFISDLRSSSSTTIYILVRQILI
jgi:hypothetical protein